MTRGKSPVTFPWKVLTVGCVLFAGCTQSVCGHFGDPSCQNSMLTLTCKDGTVTWGEQFTVGVSQPLASAAETTEGIAPPEVAVVFPDMSTQLASAVQVSAGQLLVTLPSAAARMTSGGPITVTLKAGESYRGMSLEGACRLTVPVSYLPSPSVVQKYVLASSMQEFAVQYGGRPNNQGLLYVTELVSPMRRRLERFMLSTDNTQLGPDPSWQMVRDALSPGPLTLLAGSRAGLLQYSGPTLTTQDLSTVNSTTKISHQVWSLSVPQIPQDGISLAAAWDQQRFIIANSTKLAPFGFDGANVAPLPAAASELKNILGVRIRTAPTRTLSGDGRVIPAEAIAWSASAVEILNFDAVSNQFARDNQLSSGIDTSLRALVGSDFSKVQLLLADLDDDGMQDVVGLNTATGAISWARQQSAGTFTPFVATCIAAPGAFSVSAGDMDGDGLADLIVATWDPNTQSGQVGVFFRQLGGSAALCAQK